MNRHRHILIFLTAMLIAFGGSAGRAAAGDLSMEDAKVLAAYPLTEDKLQRKFAVAADLGRLSAADPALQRQLQSVNEGPGLDAQIKAFGAIPKAAAIMQSHGISARDYCLTTLAINYALMSQVPAQLRPANLPPEPALVAAPPGHVEFVQSHMDEIHKLTAAIMQARKETQHQ
ncbi:MAG TPA: hypothetical protein VGI93_04100 [Steroidobacteraceae bacterium]|jgi:hypothetical protein